MNTVQLVGNLGRDPEFTVVGDKQTPICELNIATTEYVNRKNVTEWHNVKFFGKKAEAARDYLYQGAKVGIVGRLQTRNWINKDGKKQYKTEIVGEKLEFLSKKSGDEGASQVRSEVNESIPDASDIENMDGGESDLPF